MFSPPIYKMAQKQSTYTIYKLSDGNDSYVGMTTQALSTRLRQHKLDAKTESCTISAKLCQKEPPRDVKALHRRLRDHPAKFRMLKLKQMTGTYTQVHREEMKLKNRHATLK